MSLSMRPAFAGLFLCALLATQAVSAAGPANDNWANRTIISLPFSVTETQMNQATNEATDPDPPCRPSEANSESNTLWYGYTTGAATEYLTIVAGGTSVVSIVTVYTGSPGSFQVVSGGCASYAFGPVNASTLAGLRLAPNTSYSIKVGATFGVNPGNTLPFSVVAATQYHVTKTADTNDGVCDSDCSLREAIAASNASPGAVIIPAGTYTLSIPGALEYQNNAGDLDATLGMGIYGAGMTQTIIDANQLDRALTLDSNHRAYESFAIGDLTFQNGNAPSGSNFSDGQGGALSLAPTNIGDPDYVGIERVAFRNNTASLGGGAIYLTSPGTIRDSIIENNKSSQGGGGIAYSNDSGFLDVSGSTIDGNTDTAPGSTPGGGGIYVQGALRLTNSTVSNNYTKVSGGGIHVEGSGYLLMANSTVVFNSAGDNPNRTNIGGGLLLDSGSSGTTNVLTNNIIAGNTVINPTDPPDCAVDIFGATLSTNHNLVQSPGNCTFTGIGDLTGVDAGVMHSLAWNGGVTRTYALLAGSPALNAGDPAGCKDTFGNLLATDQRGVGFPRKIGSACDMGSVENPSTPPPASAPTLDSSSDSGVAGDGITNVSTPRIDGSCTTGATVKLQVDGIAATTFPSPIACTASTYSADIDASIAEGTHAVTATQTVGGIASLPSPPLTLVVDTTPPVVSFTSTPAANDPNPNPVFSFSANEAVSTFYCVTDSSSATPCTSPLQVGPLAIGPHYVEVLAIDIANNTGTYTRYDWFVVPPAPDAPVLDAASDSGLSNSDGITNAATTTFDGSCTDGDFISLVEGANSLSNATACSGGQYAIPISLDEGPHAVAAIEVDNGNYSPASAATTVIIDRTPPMAPAITTPSGTTGPVVTIRGTASENDGVVEVFDGIAVLCTAQAPFASGNWSCDATFTTHGAHALTAKQMDVAGNLSAASSTVNLGVDLIFRNGFE